MKGILIPLLPTFLRKYTERVKASPLGYRLTIGVLWSLFGTAVARLLGLISSIFVARMLGREEFGELGIIQSTVGMLAIFAGFGLGLTATKYVAEFRRKDPAKAGRIIAISSAVSLATGTLMALLLAIFARWIAASALAAPSLVDLLRVSALLLLLGALNGAQTGALAGFEAFRTIANVNIVAGASSFPLMVGGAYWWGLRGVVWGMVAGMGVNCILNHLALRREARRADVLLVSREFLREWPILRDFSLPAVIGGVMGGPVNWLCNVMLVNQPNGYAEMGIFTAASQWRMAILFLPGAVGAVVLPVLANLYSESDHRRYEKVLRSNVLITSGVAFSAALAMSLFASPIMRSYGPDFESGRMVLVLLAFSAVLAASSAVIGLAIVSQGRMWQGLALNTIWAIALVGSTWFFIGRGALGLALSNLIAYAIHLATVVCYLYYFDPDRVISRCG